MFQPLLLENREALEEHAGVYYDQIKNCGFPQPTVKTLLEAFVNLLEQRFSEFGKSEIETMLVGTLPDLRDTQSGKDLIHIGKMEGKIEMLLLQLEAMFGSIPTATRERMLALKSEQLDPLLLQVVKIDSLEQLTWDIIDD